MPMPRPFALATCVAAALLAGCTGLPNGAVASGGTVPASVGPGQRGGLCHAAPAQGVIGKQGTPSVIVQARVASGAAMARLLHPRQVVTLEFNTERLNLVVDANGRITAVRCG